jgi:hypothetical protein
LLDKADRSAARSLSGPALQRRAVVAAVAPDAPPAVAAVAVAPDAPQAAAVVAVRTAPPAVVAVPDAQLQEETVAA